MKKIEITYHLKDDHQISQITKMTKKKFEEIIQSNFFNNAKIIAIPEKGLYIPISSVLFFEIKEIKNGNN